MNPGIAICLAILIACIAAMNYGYSVLLKSVDFSTFMVIGSAIIVIGIIAAFGYDALERRRSQRELPPEQPDHQ